MFKLESYITPIILSYVDKYIKNFRPEDSQVSLWGGDVCFHNLDLRLDVLEEELQLPFNLVSGHIHELLIHVPWTKLASEPINITINTIECVLKLRGSSNSDGISTPKDIGRKTSTNRKQDIAAPPGYVQSLINKIVNNITINCNNLILKYVEEDIVISVNIKMLTFQSANEKWQPAYTEISPSQMIMRKLITLSDLTICLDKRNAAGKIEVYQEPILYRCSIEIRFLKQFNSSNFDKAVSTRIDVYCNRMEFSMTEQQIPMFMRIINLGLALQQRQLKHKTKSEIVQTNFGGTTDEATTSDVNTETWAGWAWSFAANILPIEEQDVEFQNIQQASGSSLQIGLYIDHVIFTFKVSEYYSNDRGYYTTRKLKYCPLICLQLNGCYVDTILYGMEWTSVQTGIAEAILLPQGCCSCGLTDVSDNSETQYYLKTGIYNGSHIINSLFDPESNPLNSRRCFNISWDHYINTVTEAVLLEKTSAFAIDFLYHLEVPEDYSSEKLSEFGSDLEYSNLVEKSICRIVAGPIVIHVCSGLIHRMSTLIEVMKSYEYLPYAELPVEPELSELHPPSEEDFDALNDSIPKRIYQITFLKPVIQIQLMDHPKFVPTQDNLFRRLKKTSGSFTFSNYTFSTCPNITLECETIDVKIVLPIYPKRLVYTTCQLPDPPENMFNSCYFYTDIKITDFSSQMVFNSYKKTMILLPFNIMCTYKSIIFPKYWINPEIIHEEIIAEIDSVTLTATKAKLMVIYHVIEKLFAMDVDEYKNSIFASSLLPDASSDAGMVVLELYGEQIKWRKIDSISTESHKFSLGSLRAFVLEPNEIVDIREIVVKTPVNETKLKSKLISDTNQVLIISGPELSESKPHLSTEKESILFLATIQFPRDPGKCIHPPVIFFNLDEIKICIDPLFFQWLFYIPKYKYVKHDNLWPTAESINPYKPRTFSDASTSFQDTPRRANTPHESIHSSSEREHNIHVSSPKPQTVEKDHRKSNTETKYYDLILNWYLVWTNIIIYGDITPCTIFFPTNSLSAVGSQGIEDAINMSLKQESPIEIMVIKLPSTSIRTSGQKQSLIRYTSHLPVTLPKTIWTPDRQSFPWTIEIKNFLCYTLQNKSKFYFIKPISGNVTMGLSIKYKNDTDTPVSNKLETLVSSKKKGKQSKSSNKPIQKKVSFVSKPVDNISSLSIYIHVDNTPIEIALSEVQVCLISSILNALFEVVDKIHPQKITYEDKSKFKDDFCTNMNKKINSRSQSPTLFKEDLPDTISERTPTSQQTEIKSNEDDSDEIKLTVWMQWTITRLRVKLYGHNVENIKSEKFSYLHPPTLKLVFELEDIMASLDLQQIYSKFKLKIVTAGILHFKRKAPESDWKPGNYLGTVMRSREELPTSEKQDDFGFMSITVTKAKCGHVHNKWGASSKKHRLSEMKIDSQYPSENTEIRYISEVVATIQPMDFIISAKVLKSFYMVLEPILNISNTPEEPKPKCSNNTISINNSNLPLAYLDCYGIRIVIISSDLNNRLGNHDICIIEIEAINLLPTAENPICRNLIRPDIYQRAAQTRILNIPGSDIEDRQYQLNLKSFSINTGSWSEFREILNRDLSVISSLHTMNENPALEWNNLESGKSSLTPNLSLLPVIQKFNQCIVIAPAIICQNCIVVCGNAIELNCVTDIEIFISLHQFRLISALITEFMCFTKPIRIEIMDKRPKFTYFNQKSVSEPTEYLVNEESLIDLAKDSGIDTMEANSAVTSKTKDSTPLSNSKDIDRRNILKFTGESKSSDISHGLKCSNTITSSQNSNCNPVEILITGGQISICLYKITNKKCMENKNIHSPDTDKTMSPNRDDAGYDASEEESVDIPICTQKVQPLLYILISQPNLFIADAILGKKINFSCFDIYIKTNESKHRYITGLPTPKDYEIYLMETKPGIRNPETGIPPAFVSIKWSKTIGKPVSLDIDFGRPVRIFYSLAKLNHLLYLKEHVIEHFYNACHDLIDNSPTDPKPTNNIFKDNLQNNMNQGTIDSYMQYKNIKDKFNGINNFNLKLAQLVFVFKTISGIEMTISVENSESYLTFSTRPERIIDEIVFKSITISTNSDGSSKFILNPWSLNFKTILLWESWQSYNSDPQIHLSLMSDCFNLDVGPEQIKCVEAITNECKKLQEIFNSDTSTNVNQVERKEVLLSGTERDQYYKDDLRAGAFQFVDAINNPNELPLPYQVMFWNNSIAAMAWRYPQPRILTKVRVFPVPFKLNSEQSNDQKVLCFLEYWSNCHGCYKPYAQFYLSESEMCYLNLPKNVPQPTVSCTWRVVLNFSDGRLNQTKTNNFVSPRALAACMRIDSYFNPILIPKLQCLVNCFSISVSFYNQFNKKLPLVMPEKLRNFTPDGLVPDNQLFLVLSAEYSNMYIAYWNSDVAIVDLKTTLKCCILDYATLNLEAVINPVLFEINLNIDDKVNISVITETIELTLNPTSIHTLAISSQLWTQYWQTYSNSEPPDMVVITRYVICNDTNLKLRFGQTNTDEDILLPSRFLHLYCWRSQLQNRSIRIGIEENDWIWSEPIYIDNEISNQLLTFSKNSCNIIVSVKSLSATQKQVIISGQLVICNMLLDHFELKVIPFNETNKELAMKNADSHIINGKSTAPSILVNINRKLALRLRFLSLESAWSGDIPLVENSKGSQPWLVKIPLQERGQFLSIWCRIVDRKSTTSQILVMLWPLFMVRSYLPINNEVHLETPALNVRLETSIRGRGELQQLYCPGTIDHSHNLIFDMGSEIQTNDHSTIPLNYSLIEHNQIFMKIEKQQISDILEYLHKYDESKWPYVDNNNDLFEWKVEEQPVTDVEVRYQNTCQYSNSLLLELLPWCMIINTLGIPVTIITKGNIACKVNHYGIVAPPKLEDTFNIAIEVDGHLCFSPLLQLARPDAKNSFYMPKINGIIPFIGTIQIPINCDIQICMVSITSEIINGLQIIQICSSYIITNYTKLQLEVTCVAISNNKFNNITDISQANSILLESHLNKKNTGVSLTAWNCIEEITDSVSDLNFHILVSLENKFAQSSPVQIDKKMIRKSICLYSHTENIPLVIIAQEHKDQIYLSIHNDIHPQLLIKNKCSQEIFCAQCDNNGSSLIENNNINWICSIYSDTETYYTMPSVSDNFPNIDNNTPEKLVLAVKCEDSTPDFQWSQEININIFNEQYVRIPQYGDVKLSIKKNSATVSITIDSVTEVEISAQDIRSRLLMQSNSNTEYKVASSSSKTCLKNDLELQNRKSKSKTQDVLYSTSEISNESNMREQISSNLMLDNEFINLDKQLTTLKEISILNKQKWDLFNMKILFKHFIILLKLDNKYNNFENTNLSTIICDYLCVTVDKHEGIDFSLSIGSIQCDNQLFHTGCFDFPVVLKGENTSLDIINTDNGSLASVIDEISSNADINITLRIEVWEDKNIHENTTEIQEIKIKLGSLSLYIEDTYITKLVEYMNNLNPTQLVLWSLEKRSKISMQLGMVGIPEQISWESKILARPLYLRNLSIESVSLLLSLHSSVKLYIALDRSPLQFNKFERKNLITTSYRLGHALTMHFLSDAIFGAGWVVGSLELLGSPSGLARTVGTGLRDFISLPYNGLIQGPWAFLVGITHGSASLMRHVTAGTLDSVTKLASSVARNLDRLTLDEEHQQRAEEFRRRKPQGVTEGFIQGITGLGISLLGAVGGIAHHPLQSMMNQGPSPRGLVGGLGLGLVGVFTKPLSGAAELVALTGQGLLQGAGWNPLPEPRSCISGLNICRNKSSVLKYNWKYLQNTPLQNNVIAITEVNYDSKSIILIVSFEALVIIDINNDSVERVVFINDIVDIHNSEDLTEIRISLERPNKTPPHNNTEPIEIEMDPVSRARVADYVKNSSGLVQMSPLASNSNSDDESISSSNVPRPIKISVSQPCLVFHVNPQIKNYLYDILVLVRQQKQNNTFKILQY